MGDVGIMGMHVPGMSWREMRDSAVLAEDLGYSCLTMGESWGEDAFTSLAQLAAVTSRIRIGTSIVPVFARSPANIAMTALNLDRMSEGRFFLGLGTSGRLVIQDLHGEHFAKPLTRMREYIDIIRKASRGEMLDHDGEFFHTKRFRLRAAPYRPGLPIYIAALSPASLRLTGEVADGWLPIFLAPSRMGACGGRARGGRQGRRTLHARHRHLAASVDLRDQRRRGGARPRAPPYRLLHRRHGCLLPPVHAPHRLRRRCRQGPRGLPGARPRQGGPARHRRDGRRHDDHRRPGACRKQIQAFFDAGVQEVRLVFNEPNKDAYLESLRAVAPGSGGSSR